MIHILEMPQPEVVKLLNYSLNSAISIHVNSAGGTGEYSGAEIYVPIKEDSARFEYYLREELSRLNAFREIFSRRRTGEFYER